MAPIKTSPDYVLEVLLQQENGKATLSDLSAAIGVDVPTIEKWAGFLKEYVTVEYPTNVISKPFARLIRVPEEPFHVQRAQGQVLSSYKITSDNVTANVEIIKTAKELVPLYQIYMPEVGLATRAVLQGLANELIKRVPLTIEDISDQRRMAALKDVFKAEARSLVQKEFAADLAFAEEPVKKHKAKKGKKGKHKEPKEEEIERPPANLGDILAGILLHNCYGLGNIELLISDNYLEEICVNSSHMPLGAYHIKHGWVRTNVFLPSEKDIYNLASQIARKAGTNITNLEPLMDAHLMSGDRANATMFPVSSFGNTITIRKFARIPWTLISFMKKDTGTISSDMAALLWLCMQYELNILVTGGTASGKTSMLNALCSLIPSNQRIVSIEGTRELSLPGYLSWNWIAMATRNKNPEGKGEVTMLDLIVNSLRMRPDRVIMGEVRRREEAEVLFEAMHTGHSVYSTIHADTSRHLVRRLSKPPFELPVEDLEAIDLVIVQFRDRRSGRRRTLEVAEIMPSEDKDEVNLNYLYRWDARSDSFEKINESKRLFEKLNLYTGMSDDEIKKDLKEKKAILEWMRDKGVEDIESVGETIGEYYRDREAFMKRVKK